MMVCRFIFLSCALSLFVLLGNVEAIEKFPNRPIELVIPFAPGGSNDLAARIYSAKLAQVLKVQLVLVNRAGASGVQGALYAARAKKDGHTLFAGGMSPLVVMPLISSEAAYDPLKDFLPLGYFGSVPSIFVVRNDSPFKSFRELIDYARKNPGKLKNAAGGVINSANFNLDILCARNNINITTIPFKGGGEATVALLGGHVDMTSSGVLTLGPHIKSGKLRPLAIACKTRYQHFPEIPTTTELGYPYMNFTMWAGFSAPSGIPQAAVDVLVPAVEKAFKDPEVVRRAAAAYFIADYMGPVAFRKFLESEIREVAKIVKDAGLREK